jgi:hypothetical protein
MLQFKHPLNMGVAMAIAFLDELPGKDPPDSVHVGLK